MDKSQAIQRHTLEHEFQELTTNVRSLKLGDMDNLVYLIEEPDTGCAAVLDPAWDVEAILDAAGDTVITDILISHWHDDHLNGVEELVAATGAPVHLLDSEAAFWEVDKDYFVRHADGECIALGGVGIQVLHTPGHSPGSACFNVNGKLFTGGTMFIYGCGRCDMPGGDAIALYHSLNRLTKMFPPETLVYPGHDYARKQVSTLGEQIRLNPFLHQPSAEAFAAFRAAHDEHRQPPYQPVLRGDPVW